MQTLLTGFGPFGAVLDNPSQRLTDHFVTHPVPGHTLLSLSLPVSFTRAPVMFDEALTRGGREGRPFDLIVMLGVAARASAWRVEEYGRNWDAAIEDVDGFIPTPAPIVTGAPERLPVTVSVDNLVMAIRQMGLPAIASDDAGGYLCNHILFHALHRLTAADGNTRAMFLHVPSDETTGTGGVARFSFAQHVAAVQAVLLALAAPEDAGNRVQG